MVGAMALLSSSMSMPTAGVVEESCIREHPSPSGSGSPDDNVSANLLANAQQQQQQQQQQQHSVNKRRRVAADTAAQRRRHRQQRTAQHRLTTGRRPLRTNRRDNSEDEDDGDEENDEDDEEEDEDDERDMDADVEEDAIIDSRREPQQQQQQLPKLQPIHPQHHKLQQQQQQQQQLYSLRWHDFQSSILSSFRHLRDVEDFVDVTLACDGKSFTAHKMVLSACSPYFRHLLKVIIIIILMMIRFLSVRSKKKKKKKTRSIIRRVTTFHLVVSPSELYGRSWGSVSVSPFTSILDVRHTHEREENEKRGKKGHKWDLRRSSVGVVLFWEGRLPPFRAV